VSTRLLKLPQHFRRRPTNNHDVRLNLAAFRPKARAGRIFDDRGNRMTPTHTNKNGACYRYYISHALLQRRNDKATRVSAHEIERAVTTALRGHVNDSSADERLSITDRELVERLSLTGSLSHRK
jgi:hypothetical protein